jgi:hypothetical protein
MEEPFLEPNSRSATQEILSILWKPDVHYLIHISPPPGENSFKRCSLRQILILFSHLRLCLPNGLCPSSFSTKSMYHQLSICIKNIQIRNKISRDNNICLSTGCFNHVSALNCFHLSHIILRLLSLYKRCRCFQLRQVSMTCRFCFTDAFPSLLTNYIILYLEWLILMYTL